MACYQTRALVVRGQSLGALDVVQMGNEYKKTHF